MDQSGFFVINLDRSPDRLAYVMPHIKSLGFPVTRVVGIDGRKLSEVEIDRLTSNTYIAKERGTIGCSLSHMKAWREFLQSQFEYAVIFEDDVTFDPIRLRSTINALVDNASYWDMNMFEISHRGTPLTLINLASDTRLVVYLTKVTHAGGYIINRKIAKRYLEKSLPIRMIIDHFFTASYLFDAKITGVEPRLVFQGFGDSERMKIDAKKTLLSRTANVSLKLLLMKQDILRFFYNLKYYLNVIVFREF